MIHCSVILIQIRVYKLVRDFMFFFFLNVWCIYSSVYMTRKYIKSIYHANCALDELHNLLIFILYTWLRYGSNHLMLNAFARFLSGWNSISWFWPPNYIIIKQIRENRDWVRKMEGLEPKVKHAYAAENEWV